MRVPYCSTGRFVLAAVIVALGVVPIPAADAGQGGSQPTGFTVIDSQGKTIGVYSASQEADYVVMKLGEDYVKTDVVRTGFAESYLFYFTEPDCQGQRILTTYHAIVPRMSVSGTTGYYLLPSDPTSSFTINSLLQTGLSCANFTAPALMSGAVARPLDLSGFVPPFSVKPTGGEPTKIGVYRNGTWYLDANGNGAWDGCEIDACISWGGDATDKAVLGDWNGSGTTKIGVYRASTGTWYLDKNGNGTWDGCGIDTCIGWGGDPADVPILGRW